jgi:hypothetical protein
MDKRRTLMFAAAAWAALGLAAAGAQPAPAAKPAAAAPAAQGKAPQRRGSSMAQDMPQVDEAELRRDHPELYKLQPVDTSYKPKRTAWGDPDLRGVWPIDSLGGLPLQRTPAMGERVYLSAPEYEARQKQMNQWKNAAAEEDKANKLGMGNWVEMTGAGRRTSLLISPANGRLPELTPWAKHMNEIGRSSWVRNQTFDWVTDFDSWDRCITRGFPASMLPFRYNNGIQILQAPGYVIVSLEMIHDARIIPLDNRPLPPKDVTSWMGFSRGHWEGNTLVVETSHITPGAAPLNMATIGAPFGNTIPMSPDAKVVERFTLTGPNTLDYEMTYSDPKVWTAPYTIRMDIPRNDKYGMYEYACHEGDEQVRNYIVASRAQRAKDAAKAEQKAEAAGPQQHAQAATTTQVAAK